MKNNKIEGEKVREYVGGDCYVYYTICNHCKKKVSEWTPDKAEKAWKHHKC